MRRCHSATHHPANRRTWHHHLVGRMGDVWPTVDSGIHSPDGEAQSELPDPVTGVSTNHVEAY